MDYREFIKSLSQKTKSTQKEAQKLSRQLINTLKEELSRGKKIKIDGFGIFYLSGNNKIEFIPDKNLLRDLNQ